MNLFKKKKPKVKAKIFVSFAENVFQSLIKMDIGVV